MILLDNLYHETPEDMEQAAKQAIWFLNGGNETKENAETSYRLYSFAKDAAFIFAAFRQTHGIDLETASLHWWKFLALFMDLGSETTFCQLVGLRKRIKSGKATKYEREAAREMGEMFDVPESDDRTLEEKEQEAEFLRLVSQGRNKNGG